MLRVAEGIGRTARILSCASESCRKSTETDSSFIVRFLSNMTSIQKVFGRSEMNVQNLSKEDLDDFISFADGSLDVKSLSMNHAFSCNLVAHKPPLHLGPFRLSYVEVLLDLRFIGRIYVNCNTIGHATNLYSRLRYSNELAIMPLTRRAEENRSAVKACFRREKERKVPSPSFSVI